MRRPNLHLEALTFSPDGVRILSPRMLPSICFYHNLLWLFTTSTSDSAPRIPEALAESVPISSLILELPYFPPFGIDKDKQPAWSGVQGRPVNPLLTESVLILSQFTWLPPHWRDAA